MKFSIVVPVYNRPGEVFELLTSLSQQTFSDFELVLVEDGSIQPCDREVEQFRSHFSINYIVKENTGRSDSRNTGLAHIRGEYVLCFDSDCILPPSYLEKVNRALQVDDVDCYGGPDKEQPSFTPMQKAINYAMTSFWTTGGIRGGKAKTGRFEPRSFNMGFSRKVYDAVGGFKNMYGEDIELSNRIRQAGFSIQLLPDAFVYHKRRVSLKKFYKQVYIFGQARINVHKLHPGSLRIVHTLPALAVLSGLIILILSVLVSPCLLSLPAIYMLLLLVDAFIRTKNLRITGLALLASLTQIAGYGTGFIYAFIKKIILRQGLEEWEMIKKVYK